MWDPFLQFGWVGGPASSKIQTKVGPAPEGRAKKEGAEGALSCLVMCDYFSRAIVTARY